MSRERLTDEDILKRLSELKGWTVEGKNLKIRLEFLNFRDALEFVNKVGEIAENYDHHPDITFGWGYAEVAFTTHDRGGITDKDFELAGEVDKIA